MLLYCSPRQELNKYIKNQYQPALNTIMRAPKELSPINKDMIVAGKELNQNGKTCLKFTTNYTYLHWLQFRILNYILTTNRSVQTFKTDWPKPTSVL